MWNSSPTEEQHSWHFYTTFQVFGFDFFWGAAKVQLFLTMQPEICNTLSALSPLSDKAVRYGSAQGWTFSGSLDRIIMILNLYVYQAWLGRQVLLKSWKVQFKTGKVVQNAKHMLVCVCYHLCFHYCNTSFHSGSCFTLINAALINNVFELEKNVLNQSKILKVFFSCIFFIFL